MQFLLPTIALSMHIVLWDAVTLLTAAMRGGLPGFFPQSFAWRRISVNLLREVSAVPPLLQDVPAVQACSSDVLLRKSRTPLLTIPQAPEAVPADAAHFPAASIPASSVVDCATAPCNGVSAKANSPALKQARKVGAFMIRPLLSPWQRELAISPRLFPLRI